MMLLLVVVGLQKTAVGYTITKLQYLKEIYFGVKKTK